MALNQWVSDQLYSLVGFSQSYLEDYTIALGRLLSVLRCGVHEGWCVRY